MAHRRRIRAATILKVRDEIERFERIFSLYRSDSEISRLNETGKLIKPSPELRKLVEESQRLGEVSGGAFDISVQPLWRLYEAHFWSQTDIQPDIAARARDVAHSARGFSPDRQRLGLNPVRARRHGHYAEQHCPGLHHRRHSGHAAQ